ncbi:MAG: DUF4157 domain-containing protein [Minicystis sp.]
MRRKCARCEDETAEVRRKCARCEDEAGELRRKEAGEGGALAGAEAPASVGEVVRSAGRPLDPGVRSFAEQRFGHDFANIRVHDDSRAAASARAVDARAYTVGEHIAFGEGEHRPSTNEGMKLLFHELAHVVQGSRTSAPAGAVQRKPAAKKLHVPGDYVRVKPGLLGLPNVPHGQPGYKLLTRVTAGTLLRVVRLLPGTDQYPGTEGVYEFKVMDDYGKPRPAADGGEIVGVADSVFVRADAGPTAAPEKKPAPKPTADPQPTVVEKPVDEGPPKIPPCALNANCPDDYCLPFPTKDAAVKDRDANLSAILSTIKTINAKSESLYRTYLLGGSGLKDISADFAWEFTSDDVTRRATEFLVDSLKADLKANPPAFPGGKSFGTVDVPSRIPKAVKEIGDPASAHKMDFTFALEAPGLLAGGIGANQASCQVGAQPSAQNDDRRVTGTAEVYRNNDGTYAVTPSLEFTVLDTIDFCPGNCGGVLARKLGHTVMMSRYEASGIAGDVPFVVKFPSPNMVGTGDDSE